MNDKEDVMKEATAKLEAEVPEIVGTIPADTPVQEDHKKMDPSVENQQRRHDNDGDDGWHKQADAEERRTQQFSRSSNEERAALVAAVFRVSSVVADAVGSCRGAVAGTSDIPRDAKNEFKLVSSSKVWDPGGLSPADYNDSSRERVYDDVALQAAQHGLSYATKVM
jgi:hypothetical protein